MKVGIYTVKDTRADTHMMPFVQNNDVQALRGFTEEVNRADEANMLWRYPQDFQLIKVATFDTETGETKPEHQLLSEGTALVRKPQ